MTSSMRSSRVTMPSVPPYSSTTIAMWSPSRRISDSAASTCLLPGSALTSRATLADRAVAVVTQRRQHQVADVHEAEDVVLAAPDDRVARVRRLGRPPRAARLTVIDPSRKVTSVRGTITSSIERSPAAKTSSISVRSSVDSDSCAATSPRSSSSLIGSRAGVRVAAEQPHDAVGRLATAARSPAGRTLASRFSGGGEERRQPSRRAAAPGASGASSPSTSVTKEMIRVTPTTPVALASPSPQPWSTRNVLASATA